MSSNKLLVADDSLTIQKVIRLALSNEGYEIQAVTDGSEVLHKCTVFRPDVLLIDVALPGKSAFEVKKEWNSTVGSGQLKTRFILMSSAFEKVDQSQVAELGFLGNLVKPFDPIHLRKVLSDALAQNVSLSPAAIPLSNTTEVPPPPPSSLSPPPVPLFSEAESTPSPFSDQLPEDFMNDLWNQTDFPNHELLSVPPSPPVIPAVSSAPPFVSSSPPPPPPLNDDEDIRQLTESTLQGIGPVPVAASAEAGASPVHLGHSSDSDEFPLHADVKSEPLPEPFLESLPGGEGLVGAAAPLASGISSDQQWSVSEPILQPLPAMLEQTEAPSPPLVSSSAAFSTVSNTEIQAWVKEQVEVLFLKLSKELLPDIAERLIKQEINKILSE